MGLPQRVILELLSPEVEHRALGGRVPPRTQNTWAVISLKAKAAGKCGNERGHFSKPFMASVLKAGAHAPISPCLRGERDSEIESRRAPYAPNHWKQARDALRSVNTREVKCALAGPLMY